MKEVESLGLRNEVGNLLLDALNCFSREEENALDKSQVEALLLEASSEYCMVIGISFALRIFPSLASLVKECAVFSGSVLSVSIIPRVPYRAKL